MVKSAAGWEKIPAGCSMGFFDTGAWFELCTPTYYSGKRSVSKRHDPMTTLPNIVYRFVVDAKTQREEEKTDLIWKRIVPRRGAGMRLYKSETQNRRSARTLFSFTWRATWNRGNKSSGESSSLGPQMFWDEESLSRENCPNTNYRQHSKWTQMKTYKSTLR